MSLGNEPVSKTKISRDPSPDIVAEVTVSTASAIVTSTNDPYRILVAYSEKHPKPVIPGGKVETEDLASDAESPGLTCVLREVKEEIGTDLLNATYVGKAQDPDRDIRAREESRVSCSRTSSTSRNLGGCNGTSALWMS